MNQPSEPQALQPGGSFFTKAAWLSLIVPFLVPVIWFCILAATDRMDLPAMLSFFVLVSSLALGIASLFGIPRHGRKRIIWKAVPGIIASAALGYFALVFWSMSHNWHG